MRPPPAAVAKGPAAAPPVTANLAALREHWEALAAQHARACPVASRRMKPGAAPPSVKPTLLRAQDQGREPSLVVLDGPPPGTSETMLTDRGRLHRTSIRVNGGARNQVIMRAHSCLRSCLLVLGRAAAHRRAERRWGRKTERDLSDESTGDTRVDLSRTSAIQRLRETQGVDGISFTVHPVGTPTTVHPLAPRAPSARQRPRRRAAPSRVPTSAGRSCCCGWATAELCTSPPREGAAPAAPSAVLYPPPPSWPCSSPRRSVFPVEAAHRRVFVDAGCSHSIQAAIILSARVLAGPASCSSPVSGKGRNCSRPAPRL